MNQRNSMHVVQYFHNARIHSIFDQLSNRKFFVPKEKTESMKNNIYNIYLKSPLTKKELKTLWGITKKLTK